MWPRSVRFSTPPARRADPIVDQVLADLRASPIAEEATRRAFERRQDERLHHAAEIVCLQAEEATQLAAAQVEIDAAAADLATARAALVVAERRSRAAAAERSRISLAGSCGVAMGRHRAALRDLAEPALALFLDEMDALRRGDRNIGLSETIRGGAIEMISGRKTRYVQSNVPSALSRNEAIGRAISEAQALALEPDQSDLVDKLDALRAAIPAVKSETVRVNRITIDPPSRVRNHRYRRSWALSQEEEEAEREAVGAPI